MGLWEKLAFWKEEQKPRSVQHKSDSCVGLLLDLLDKESQPITEMYAQSALERSGAFYTGSTVSRALRQISSEGLARTLYKPIGNGRLMATYIKAKP